MRVQIAILALLFASLLLVAGCGTENGSAPDKDQAEAPSGTAASPTAASTPDEISTLTITSSGGEEVEVQVEIADDDVERSRGLMERTELAENAGMLFVFEDEQLRSFWMRNTLIPLSIAYIDADGRIVDIQDMEPLDDEPPQYVSAEPAQYALEVNQGFFDEHGVEVGDRAELPKGQQEPNNSFSY